VAKATASVEDLESGHLPDVCAKTGLHADGFTTIQVSDIPGWTIILLFFGIWPFLIALYFAPRRIKGRVPMSGLALQRLRRFTAIYLVLLTSAFVLLGIGLFGEHPTFAWLGFIGLLATILFISSAYLFVYPTGRFLDKDWVSLSFVDQRFADALDRWYGQAPRQADASRRSEPLAGTVTRTLIIIVAIAAVLYFLSLAYCSQDTDSNAATVGTSSTRTQPYYPTRSEGDRVLSPARPNTPTKSSLSSPPSPPG